MKPFNVMISEEDRANLEKHRVRLGLRSHGEVIRFLIAQGDYLHHRKEAIRLVGEMAAAANIPDISKGGAPNTPEVQLGFVRPKPGSMLKKR